MTLILSVENDYSTNQVIHWLRHYKKPFVRLNENDRIVIHDLTHDGFVFEIKGGILKFSEISSIWYRRGDLNVDTFADAIELKKSIFKAYNQKEVAQIKDYIYHLLSQKTHINARHQCNINK